MKKNRWFLEDINNRALDILVYFTKNLIHDAPSNDIELFLLEFQKSLVNFKDRRSSYTFQRFMPYRRFRDQEKYQLSKLTRMLEDFRKFFRVRQNGSHMSKYDNFTYFFHTLDERVGNYSKTVERTLFQLVNSNEENSNLKIANGSIYKACSYWYMNSSVIPKFSKISHEKYRKLKEFKRMLHHAFILFFRWYEQSNLHFEELDAFDLELEMDYLIQDTNNLIRFIRKIK